MVQRSVGKVVLCFPGQLNKIPEGLGGKGHKGGGRLSHPFFEKGWELAGFDLTSFFFQDEEEDRFPALKLQVATYLLSMVSFDRYRNKGGTWDFITEHSMGIYAALAAADAMTFEQGLAITKGIGLIVEKAGEQVPGGMAAVIGLTSQTIKQICADVDGSLYVANVNGSRQFVLSGDAQALEQGIALSMQQGAISAQRLPFTTPLHSPLMEPILDTVRRFLADFEIGPPRTPLISHWDSKPLQDPHEIKEFLAVELYKPVDWEGCVQHLLNHGVTCFIEMGVLDSLTKLIRWIDRDVKALSYGTQDIE
jgi:[acyl-carrier-protein] S-malonyltransferase